MEQTFVLQLRVDVAFRTSISGPPLPTDHGYALFAALCRLDKEIHSARWLAIHPMPGHPLGDGLGMRPRIPALRLRVPPEKIAAVMPLAGKSLDVAGTKLHLGTSQLYQLRPAPVLASRLVTIKGYIEPGPFEERINKDLAERGIKAATQIGRRRVVTVNGDKVVGFGMRLVGLSDEHSLQIQYTGLGGRQRFGCGIFGPATREERKS